MAGLATAQLPTIKQAVADAARKYFVNGTMSFPAGVFVRCGCRTPRQENHRWKGCVRGLVQDSAIGGRFSQCQKGIKRGSVTQQKAANLSAFARHLTRMLKRFQMLEFRGSTQEKWSSEIFRFGYRKAANDPAPAGVPDPVGSEGFCNAFTSRGIV
jgi:hypothetical protein